MSYVNYRFDTFKKFEPFNFYTYEEVCDAYGEVEQELYKHSKHTIGNNTGPFDSNIDKNFPGKPVQHLVSRGFTDSTFSKADITAMDMNEYGKVWNKWVYLVIPKEIILNYQTTVLDNKFPELINIFKTYANTVIKEKLTRDEARILAREYDEKYPDPYPIETWRPMRPGWRFDLEVSMLWSVLSEGIIYPIAYNNNNEILERGTHRSLIFSLTGNDVPIFVTNTISEEHQSIITLETHINFHKKPFYLKFHMKNKKIDLFNFKNEKISSFNSRS